MDVRLVGWKYKDIRGGLSGIEVKLGSPPSRWALIQMPNGMGKTTTMHLLRAAFSGEELPSDVVKSFRPSDDVDKGEFEVVLTVGEQTHRITLTLNYDTGAGVYQTSKASTQAGGKQAGRVLPKELDSLLTPAFTRLFIFDGELARQIRDLKHEKAAEAIRALYRLDRLGAARLQIDRLVEEQQRTSSATTAQTSQGVRNLKTRLETAQKKLADLQRAERTLDANIAEGRRRRDECEEAIREHLQQSDEFRARGNELERKRTKVNTEIVDIAKSTLAEIRNPVVIHVRILDELAALGNKMQRLKLPKTMSVEFFHELAEQSACVCARSIGPKERDAILSRAQDYLSEDQIGVVNAIKSAVRQHGQITTAFDARAVDLREKIAERQALNGDWDRLQAERVAAGDSKLQEIQKEKEDLDEEITELEEKLEQLTTTDQSVQKRYALDEKNNIALCKAAVKERLKAFHEASGTVTFLRKATVTKDLIERIENRAMELTKERLRNATNEKLKSFIPTESIRVARIGGALELESDQLGSKQHVSEGQSLAIAYAFLTSLFEQGAYRLPFIVDSPAGSLDLRVRREVAELVPDLFDQMIMFVISSEREGFAEPFYGRKGVRFLTIWRDQSLVTQLSTEVAFFKQFHSEDENTRASR